MKSSKNDIFKVPQGIRFFTIFFACLALVYVIYYIFGGVPGSDRWFKKAIPYIVLVLVGNVLYKNLFGVNTIRFTDDSLILGFLLRPKISIKWNNISELAFSITRGKHLILTYMKNEKKCTIILPRGVSGIVDVLSEIAARVPDIILDEFLASVITIPDSKK